MTPVVSLKVRVAERRQEAEGIVGFTLVDPDGRDLPPFSAGAHIDVEVAPGLTRQYSLCNAPHQRDRYDIAVQREVSSRGGSAAMTDKVQQGDLLLISEPRNHFSLVAGARRSLLLAGGIGITPILCMAERLANAGERFELHYAVRTQARAAFRERIACSSFADRVQFHFDDGAEDQRLDLPALLSSPDPDTHLYVCGPGPMIDAALSTAERSGWKVAQLHREFFTPPQVEAGGDAPFQVRVTSTGKVFDVPVGRAISEVLLENGLPVPTSCEQGVCGTCITRVIEGVPDHRDFFLMPEEQAKNDQMALCCSRAKSALLVLDI